MFNCRTWLPIAIIGFGLFIPTSYGMKSMDTGGNGIWEKLDLDVISTMFPPSRNFLFKANFISFNLEIWNKNGTILQKKFEFLHVLKYQFSSNEKFFGAILCINKSTFCKIFSTVSRPWKELKTFEKSKKIKFSNETHSQCYTVGMLGEEGKLDIFELNAHGVLKKKCFFKNVFRYAFLPKSTILSVSYNQDSGKKEFWDTSTWKKVTLDFTVKFSPDGVLCAKINKNNRLTVSNRNNGQEVISFDNILNTVSNSGFAFSGQGTFLGFILKDNTLYIWNTKIQKISAIFRDILNFKFSRFDDSMITIKTRMPETKKIFKYVPPTNPFDPQNYKNTTQQDHIKNFFSGQSPKDVKYADLNILFQ